MLDRWLERWFGVALSVLGISATLWLAFTDRLTLYIHPRYVTFTAVMSVIAALLVLASSASRSTGVHEGHLDHRAEEVPRRRTRARVALLAAVAVAMLIVPPSPLSVATAHQRQVNQTLGSTTVTSVPGGTSSGEADFSHFRIRDWAAAIQLASSPAMLRGRQFDEIGFIAPDGGRSDAFYVSRFVVTCCAVDAQPVGVSVLSPGWRSSLKEGAWVRVRGSLGVDPHDTGRLVVVPTDVAKVSQPRDPYEH